MGSSSTHQHHSPTLCLSPPERRSCMRSRAFHASCTVGERLGLWRGTMYHVPCWARVYTRCYFSLQDIAMNMKQALHEDKKIDGR
jgi:hypothetical protein